ncbi:MAG TPA: hypothetical protein VH393_12090, partial [Ktedonobacterales bacterium]
FGEIGRQILLAGGIFPYLVRLFTEVKGMVVQSPCAQELTMPIVIINGEQDELSRPSRIIPVQRSDNRGISYISSLRDRETYLRANLFRKSPYVRMIVARKMGYHSLVAFRPLEVARASLYLLARWDHTHNAHK